MEGYQHTAVASDAKKLGQPEGQLFSDTELYLIGEGNELLLYDKLGAQFRENDGAQAVSYTHLTLPTICSV